MFHQINFWNCHFLKSCLFIFMIMPAFVQKCEDEWELKESTITSVQISICNSEVSFWDKKIKFVKEFILGT